MTTSRMSMSRRGFVKAAGALAVAGLAPAIVRGQDAYELDTVGWPNTPAPADAPARWVYDTKVAGYANTGHTFGDKLSAAERTAVIEYLKTL